MTKRKRHRIFRCLLLLLIVFAFVVNLPFAQPVRIKFAVLANEAGYDLLWSKQLSGFTRDRKGFPHRWVRATDDILTNNLASLGELESIRIPITKKQFDYRFNHFSWDDIPAPCTNIYWYQSQNRQDHSFEVQFHIEHANAWIAYVDQLQKQSEPAHQ